MKTILCCLLIISLAACQKEIQLPEEDPKTGRTTAPAPPTPSTPSTEPPACPLPEPPPADTVYREEPNQVPNITEFGRMLRADSQYQITEYYCLKKDLWNDLQNWVKDDIYIFREYGKSWIAAGTYQHPSNAFDTLAQKWKVYGEGNEMKFDWADQNYAPKTYTVVAYKSEESFTLRTYANDSTKVFYTFTYLGKLQ